MATKKPQKKGGFLCYYCKREFDTEKTLIIHQKVKHFSCDICNRRLNGSNGLLVHHQQIHRRTIDKIPNALPEFSSFDVDVYGMRGIPLAEKSKTDFLDLNIKRHMTTNAIISEAVDYCCQQNEQPIERNERKNRKISLQISSTFLSPEELRAINIYNKS